MCGLNPLLLREKLGAGGSLPGVRHCARGGIYSESVVQSFLPASVHFLICLMCKSHSTPFRISLRGTCSTCIFLFGGSVGGGIFRSFLCHHLGLESKCSFSITDRVVSGIHFWSKFVTAHTKP